MCCTCDAAQLIDARRKGKSVTFTWEDAPDVFLEVEAEGDRPESAPAKVRVRKQGGEWSVWFDTHDLAGTMLRLGTDVKWRWVDEDVRAWLTGDGVFPEIHHG
jgi:hypothetical protein